MNANIRKATISDLSRGNIMQIENSTGMNYKIRPIESTEYGVLEDFLYEAIFIPEGMEPPPREIIEQPQLQVYLSDFGERKGDIGLVAEVDRRIIGAVWVRIMNDYGHIDDETPSFAISLYADYRKYGIGTALMKEMLKVLKQRGYKQASLAVQKANYAVKMYQKVDFEIVDENEEEYIMLCNLRRKKMQIANCNGDFECSSWEELEKLIRKSALNPLDDIWISGEEEYPCLAILINGKDACVHFFYEEGDAWQSIGQGDRDVEFFCNGAKSILPGDAVVSLEQAVECGKEFYDTLDMPECIEWREL